MASKAGCDSIQCQQLGALNRDLAESMEYIDSVKDSASLSYDSPELRTALLYTKMSGRPPGESHSGRTVSSCVFSVNADMEHLGLGADRSSVCGVLPTTFKNVCEDSTSGSPVMSVDSCTTSVNHSAAHELGRKSPGADARELKRSGDSGTSESLLLSNQLVNGPCITLPPTQLPVDSSYCSPNLDQTKDPPTAHVAGQMSQRSSGTVDRSSGASSTTTGVIDKQAVTPGQPPLEDPTKPKAKKTPNDFVFGKVIGEGSYSTVYLAKEVSTQREFAIKVCDKKHLLRERKTHFVMREKEVLMKLDHPFFIKLAYTFQDPERLYYVLTYARNGELLGYLHKLSAFDVPCTRFYSAEIILALEYLHSLGIIHRDLKPENILLSEDMHIKITDFGTSKILSQDSQNKSEGPVEAKRKNSFVGTAEYVSPEVLNNQPADVGSDLWALGCIIFQCLSGSLPFRSGNEYQTFQKIIKAEYEFPEGFHTDAKDVVQKLLVLEPTARLGVAKPQGMQALKNHKFYEGIDWNILPESTPPRLMPYLPATANNPEFWGQEQRPGFDDLRLAEIITGQTGADGSMSPELEEVPLQIDTPAEDAEKKDKLRKQRLENAFHPFVQDNLILKQGFVDKRKGLFARKRMLLLTEGPHLYYVDAHNKVLKGEIPWSKYLKPEAKNFKIFFVHTPNRTYYLESRQPDAQAWVKEIKDVWKKYYGSCSDK